MNQKFQAVLSVFLVAAAPLSALAGSLWCNDNIITPGITIEQLLQACGEPASRNGANWTYKQEGSFPQVVTLGNGVVMFIRDASEVESSASPLGAPP